jgi:hypothetical protein
VDHVLRQALDRAAIPYAVITGAGPARLRAAMAALQRAMAAPPAADAPRWRYRCRRCDRVDCGLPLFAGDGQALPAEVADVGHGLQAGPGVPDTGAPQ